MKRTPIGIALASAVVVITASAASGAPSLRVIPTPITAGEKITAYGAGFCGNPTCPRVQVLIGEQVVATTAVTSSGTFRVSFPAPSIPDQYTVVASQGGNPATRASTGLLVAPSDAPPTAAPRTTVSGSTTATNTTSPSSTQPVTAPPQQTTSHTSSATSSSERLRAEGAAGRDRDGGGDGPPPWLLGGVALIVVGAASIYGLRRLRATPRKPGTLFES